MSSNISNIVPVQQRIKTILQGTQSLYQCKEIDVQTKNKIAILCKEARVSNDFSELRKLFTGIYFSTEYPELVEPLVEATK